MPGTALNAKPAPMVLSLVERGGNIRSQYLDDKNIRGALDEHLHMGSRLVTDGSSTYKTVMPLASQHESVDHSKFEWSRSPCNARRASGSPIKQLTEERRLAIIEQLEFRWEFKK